MLFSNHDGSLQRRQPKAMTIGQKERGNLKPKVDLAYSICVCLSAPSLVLSWMSESDEMSKHSVYALWT